MEKERKEEKTEISALKITDVHADFEGVYLRADIPVSYTAFRRIVQALKDEAVDIKADSCGGSATHCYGEMGPFTDYDEAKRMIEALRGMLKSVYENEQKYVKQFQSLEGEYPLV